MSTILSARDGRRRSEPADPRDAGADSVRDPAPLASPRPPEKRFIGACRHYALLACSALRHRACRPACPRRVCQLLQPGLYDDHWVTEYWDDGRWRLMDAELTSGVRRHFGITFDSCDVPRDRFVTAGPAWLGVRSVALIR